MYPVPNMLPLATDPSRIPETPVGGGLFSNTVGGGCSAPRSEMNHVHPVCIMETKNSNLIAVPRPINQDPIMSADDERAGIYKSLPYHLQEPVPFRKDHYDQNRYVKKDLDRAIDLAPIKEPYNNVSDVEDLRYKIKSSPAVSLQGSEIATIDKALENYSNEVSRSHKRRLENDHVKKYKDESKRVPNIDSKKEFKRDSKVNSEKRSSDKKYKSNKQEQSQKVGIPLPRMELLKRAESKNVKGRSKMSTTDLRIALKMKPLKKT